MKEKSIYNLFGLAIILFSNILLAQEKQTTPEKSDFMKDASNIKNFRGVDHVGITVPDMEEATVFFKEALNAKVLYDVLNEDDSPMTGETVEHQLGIPSGSKIVHMRLLEIGNGPSIEMFKLNDAPQDKAAGLKDYGLQHIAIYVEDIEEAARKFKNAKGELLSNPHGLANIESGPENKGVYGRTPWGMLVELITYPDGLKDKSIVRWTPEPIVSTKPAGDHTMIKMTMFLKRNPNLSHDEFVKHHIEKHGPLFRQIPEGKEHVIRYIQTHPIKKESELVKTNDYDGTAELWFDSLQGLEKTLGSDFYKNRVFPDEKTFLDHDNTLILLGKQVAIIGANIEAKKLSANSNDGAKTSGKIAAITKIIPKKDQEKTIENAILDLRKNVVQESGNLEFTVSKEQAGNAFVIYEVFKDQDALNVHKKQVYLEEFNRALNGNYQINEVTMLEPFH